MNRTLGTLTAMALAASFVSSRAHAEGAWDRNGFDTDDLEALERRHPGLSARFLRGESELRAGNVPAAVASFAKITGEAPENALASRRYCQALTRLGKRPEALAACQNSIEKKASAPGFRAFVGALMSAPPTPEELMLATQLAAAAKRRMSDQPWSLAAVSDIAERTGDQKMLEGAVTELERIAPDHYETLRARHALDGTRLPHWAWGAWLGFAFLGFGTTARAAALALRARRRTARIVVSAFLLLGALLHVGSACAADAAAAAPPPGTLSKWPINDADPVKSLPTAADRDKNPLEFGYHMMDLADKADIARRKGDFLSVGKYYEAMATAVPDRAIGYRKSCEGYEQAGNVQKATDLCRGALAAEGVELNDYQHFAKLVLGKAGPLSATDTEDLAQIATHLEAAPATKLAGLKIQCDLAERVNELKPLQDCTALVTQLAPNDPKLVVYQWAIAMKQEDYQQAQALIATARQKALRPAGIELMERATQEQSALGRRALRLLQRNTVPLAVVLGVLSALGLGVVVRRRLKLHPA